MTRIASIATYPISVPRPVVTWTAQEEMKAWSVILTELKTDDGLTGYGLIHGSPILSNGEQSGPRIGIQ